MRIHKTSHANSKIGQNGELVCFQQCFKSIAHLSFFQNLSNKGKKKKWNFFFKKKWTTLDPSLHFGFPNREFFLKFSFWSEPIGFPSKMMPCKLNHNLIYVGLGPLSKGLGTNLKLLTNKNVQFHWTLILGLLFKVALWIAFYKWHIWFIMSYLAIIHTNFWTIYINIQTKCDLYYNKHLIFLDQFLHYYKIYNFILNHDQNFEIFQWLIFLKMKIEYKNKNLIQSILKGFLNSSTQLDLLMKYIRGYNKFKNIWYVD